MLTTTSEYRVFLIVGLVKLNLTLLKLDLTFMLKNISEIKSNEIIYFASWTPNTAHPSRPMNLPLPLLYTAAPLTTSKLRQTNNPRLLMPTEARDRFELFDIK